jgi:hypothetical protein
VWKILTQLFEYGFELKYSGPRRPFEAKRTKAKKLLDITKILLSKKLWKKYNLVELPGHFRIPLFLFFAFPLYLLYPKQSSSEFRLIHNLSFPPENSVNDFINKEFCTVKYSSINDAVRMIYKLGKKITSRKMRYKVCFSLIEAIPWGLWFDGF